MSPTISEPASGPTQGGDVSSSNDTIQREETKREEEEPAKQKKPTAMDKLKKLWAKTQLDVPTMKTMAKGALAPTIALAAYV